MNNPFSNLHPVVKKELKHIAVGTAAGVAVMLVVFALLHRFTLGVAISGILGGGVAVLNFFVLGLTVQNIASQESEDQNRKRMQLSYNLRMLLIGVWLVINIVVPGLSWLAAGLTLLLPRITIGIMQLTGMYKKDDKPAPQDEPEGK